MKKLVYFLALPLITSCDSSNDNIQSDFIVDDDLSHAVITPSKQTLKGYNKTVEFSISKNGKILNNTKFNWTSSNEKTGTINNGKFYSKIIGSTNITVKDSESNTLTASIIVNPEVTDIPEIPYIKWGANSSDVINNVSGWNLSSTTYPYGDPIYTKGTWTLKYYNGSSGLWKIELSSYDDTIGTQQKFQLHNSERYELISTADPNYYGYIRWYYINPLDNKKVYVDIGNNGGTNYYLRFKNN